jgi:hypothetical protein
MTWQRPDFDVFDDRLVEVKDITPFAEGGNRLCFVHPDHPELCLKVNRPNIAEITRAAKPFYKRLRPLTDFDDNFREYQAYQQRAITEGTDRVWDHLPRCYGWQETDIGPALISDYYAGPNGRPAKTLEHKLHTEGLTPEVQNALDDFANWLRDTLVFTKNILPHNLVFDSNGRLALIDGLGLLDYVPIRKYSKVLTRRYIEQRIERMYLRAAWEVSDKSTGWRKVEKRGFVTPKSET